MEKIEVYNQNWILNPHSIILSREEMRVLIWFIIVSCFLFSSNLSAQDFKINDKLLVCAESGLVLRSEPTLKGEKLGLLKYGSEVMVIDTSAGNPYVYEDIEGKWLFVEFQEMKGFVFDGFLTRLPLFPDSLIYDHFCFMTSLEIFCKANFEIVDSINYYNYSNGEGDHKMDIYEIKGGHLMVSHTYWESNGFELQLKGISKREGDILVNSILKACGCYNGKFPIKSDYFTYALNDQERLKMFYEQYSKKLIIQVYAGL
ncbi:MAG: SH3 domain-containing protein [Saprospiraceae bacterium]